MWFAILTSEFYRVQRDLDPPHNTAVIGSHSHHIPSQFTVISFTHVVSILQVARQRFRIHFLSPPCVLHVRLSNST
jgi:hypothetical protein